MCGVDKMSKVYIAAPFFNDKQLQIVEDIKAILEEQGL
jgi:nucleoside 2-deoxyribosyltransferase